MRNLLALFFSLLCHTAFSQKGDDIYDTARRMDPLSTDIQLLKRGFSFSNDVDSGMLYLQQYNHVKRKNVAMQDLGDVGTPYLNLMFQPNTNGGLITGFNPYGDYYFYNSSAKFYQTKMPFTTFNYVQGKAGQFGRGMINFYATHTQNIGERFNFAVNFHSTTNEGFYQRNSTNMKNTQVTNYYRSKDRRYLVSTILSWNKTVFSENGGIYQSGENDSLFRYNTSKLRYVPVELVSARNISRYRDYQLNQTYWLKGKYSDDTFHNFKPQLGVSWQVNHQKQTNYYTDKTADFNSHIYDSTFLFNGNYSADSMGFINLGNSFEIFTPLNEKGISFSAGARYEMMELHQQANKHNYHQNFTHNASAYGQLNFNFLRNFKSELKGHYFFSGYNQNDYLLQWRNEALLSKQNGYKVTIDVLSNAMQPTYQQQVMISNHYLWKNNFKQQFQQSVGLGLSKKFRKPAVYNAVFYTRPDESFSVKVNYTLINNYLFYGFDARPGQLLTAESILQLYAKKHFNLRKFQVNQELVYQSFSGGLKSRIMLPKLLSKTSLYYQSYAFKKATFLQVGVDINYTSQYQAKFYNPATRNFQQSNVKIGNYPYADLFVNMEIKTARIYLKLEHFNQDLMGTTQFPNYFYTSPYQPSALRRVRLGFVWKFYY